MIEVTLFGPPRGKGRPRFTIKGHAYTDAATRAYELKLAWQAKAVHRGPPLEGPLVVAVTAFMPIPASWTKKMKHDAEGLKLYPMSKPDIDNCIKSALDALSGIVWVDDKQIVALSARKFYAIQPRLTIKVERWDHDRPIQGIYSQKSD